MVITRARLGKGLATLAATGLVLAVFPGSSGAQVAPGVTGVVACDATTGNQVVTWTFTNTSGVTATITTATVDDSGLISGSTIDTTATMSPNPVDKQTTSTGTTRAEGAATGDYHLIVDYVLADTTPTADGEVVLPGGCVQDATTTTAPTTTAAPATKAAVAATPAFTG